MQVRVTVPEKLLTEQRLMKDRFSVRKANWPPALCTCCAASWSVKVRISWKKITKNSGNTEAVISKYAVQGQHNISHVGTGKNAILINQHQPFSAVCLTRNTMQHRKVRSLPPSYSWQHSVWSLMAATSLSVKPNTSRCALLLRPRPPAFLGLLQRAHVPPRNHLLLYILSDKQHWLDYWRGTRQCAWKWERMHIREGIRRINDSLLRDSRLVYT